ncbi:MAG: phage major capsid protein [Armatimonadota bacterium]
MAEHEELAQVVAEKLRRAMGEIGATMSGREAQGKLQDPLVREELERLVEAKLAEARLAAREHATADLQRKFELVVQDAAAEGAGWPPSEELLAEVSEDEGVRAVQKANDELYLLSKLTGRPATRLKYFEQLQDRGLMAKALATTASGAGAEWVPQGFSARLVGAVQAELRLSGLHDHIVMPTKSYQLPVEGADPTPYLTAENNEITDSNIGTANVVLDAVTVGARQVFSAELGEDSVVPILPRLQVQLARALARGIENAMVNGDVSATHMDSDVTEASDVRKAWRGYRKQALTHSAANADLSTLTADSLLSIKKALGSYALDPAECVWVVGTSVFNRLLLLRDSGDNPMVSTVDKYGPQATLVSGELGRLFGIPVVVSPLVREDLNAGGVYDGTTKTKTVLFLVNRRAWVLGDRRRITLETDKNIASQQLQLVVTWRGDFAHCFGTKATVGMGYNITA